MKIDWKKYDPPGMESDKEQGLFITGMFCTFLYSISYFDAYWDSYRRLWEGTGDKKILRPERVIDPFFELVDKRLMGYLIVAVCMFVAVAVRYAYYWRGSKSIYLMRRLPDPGFLHRSCWVRPLVRMGLCALAALITLLVYFAVYVGVTPDVCLPWN